MSIQDESFPYDELFDLDSSPTPVNRFQFPHRLREGQKHQLSSKESDKSMVKPTHNLSTSNSFPADQTISSAECTTEQPTEPAAIANDSMIKSDRTGLPTSSNAPSQLLERSRKSRSYHDIHSEYTKRRYKHVESKVGQYIANIRSEDERRRRLAKIQRHRSLPESLVRDPLTLKRMQLQRGVTVAAESLNQPFEHVIDRVNDDMEEPDAGADVSNSNMTEITSATTSTQSGSATTDDGDDDDGREADKSNEGVLMENCKDGFIDKNTYALLLIERDRLKSYNDYQQLKLDEKQCEIMRLRQNVDFLRVRLSTAEDQIKKNQNCRYTRNGTSIGSFGYGQTGVNSLPSWGTGKQSLQGLLYCTSKSTKETQTECDRCYSPPPPPPPPPTPSPPNVGIPNSELQIHVTADTPDGSNNLSGESIIEKCGRHIKSVAAIQPMALNFSNYPFEGSAERRSTEDNVALRRRSNSLTAREKCVEATNAKNSDKSQYDSRTSHPSSSDSAIDVEVIELSSSPKPVRRKRNKIDMKEKRIHAPKAWSLKYSRGPKRTPSPSGLYIERCSSTTAMDISATTEVQVQGVHKMAPRKTGLGGRSISRRWLNLFGSCVRCKNPKYTEREQLALQHTYTQVPLLDNTFEKSYIPLQSN